MARMPLAEEQRWMNRALELAARGRGRVEPNPLVGCVIVREGRVVGEGWHQRFGGPHAEREALQQVENAEDLRGATWFVTLEPCSHHGKTPPCVESVIASQPTEVVIAMSDPYPEVDGRGIAQLEAANITVRTSVCEDAARRLNSPYLKRLFKRRPWVIAKWAMSLDGKISTRTGESRWISNPTSRRLSHEIRGKVDAIVVGKGTVIRDDPLLTARPAGPRVARRVVFDREATLPSDCQVLCTAREFPVLLVCGANAPMSNVDRVRSLGAEVLCCQSDDAVQMVLQCLDHLYDQQATNVLVEGGGELHGSFLAAGEIDEVHVFIGPKLIGGQSAPGPVGGVGFAALADAWQVESDSLQLLDGDAYFIGRRPPPKKSSTKRG
jgi:diaminohydroxyphosphoribosylaminopyrimidine deaminase/5-amino-6-(5-phosphoribosylamino)uracil reductase